MTDEPQQPVTSSAETRKAVAAQIQDVRDVLRTDGAAAGIDIERVDAAVDNALAAYARRPRPRIHRGLRRAGRPIGAPS